MYWIYVMIMMPTPANNKFQCILHHFVFSTRRKYWISILLFLFLLFYFINIFFFFFNWMEFRWQIEWFHSTSWVDLSCISLTFFHSVTFIEISIYSCCCFITHYTNHTIILILLLHYTIYCNIHSFDTEYTEYLTKIFNFYLFCFIWFY